VVAIVAAAAAAAGTTSAAGIELCLSVHESDSSTRWSRQVSFLLSSLASPVSTLATHCKSLPRYCYCPGLPTGWLPESCFNISTIVVELPHGKNSGYRSL